MILCSVLKGNGLGNSSAGFKGVYDIQGIAQPTSVETSIKLICNRVSMIMYAIICVIFVVSFNLAATLRSSAPRRVSRHDLQSD